MPSNLDFFKIFDSPSITSCVKRCYKLVCNLYKLKDKTQIWYECFNIELKQHSYNTLKVDSCLYTKNGIILVLYVDDAILILPSKTIIKHKIQSLKQNFSFTDKGDFKDYLGICSERKGETIELT